MARITIEDCLEHVPNRFHLVRMASIRAKQLKKGALPLLNADENKHIVMSLREIAAGLVKPGEVKPGDVALSTAKAEPSNDSNAAVAVAEVAQTEEVVPAPESDETTTTSEG